MTYRDANDLTDFLDLRALSRRQPTFPELPALAAAGDTPARLACTVTGPGTRPPPVPPVPPEVEIRSVRVSRRLRGVVVDLKNRPRHPQKPPR
jgi:hypothetical protein